MRHKARTKSGLEMAFGYDRPLQEYFVQVYDEQGDLALDYNSSGQSMVPVPECQKPLSNSKIYDLIVGLMDEISYNRHKQNLESILLDIPF